MDFDDLTLLYYGLPRPRFTRLAVVSAAVMAAGKKRRGKKKRKGKRGRKRR